MKRSLFKKHQLWYVAGFLIINLAACIIIGNHAYRQIQADMNAHALQSQEEVQSVMDDYRHSFQLFTTMLEREVEAEPKQAVIWKYLKKLDKQLQAIEGDTFDGLYMYYRNSYLYSWDTPYEQYEKSGYDATTRPWYRNAVDAKGEIVFTPPYMSFANHYILSTISQLQPDQKTVFAYDIKMGNIQKLVASLQAYDKEQLIIFDKKGTIIGSSEEDYLGGNLMQSTEENREQLTEANNKLKQADSSISKEDRKKLEDEASYAQAFYDFQNSFSTDFNSLLKDDGMQLVDYQNQKYFGLIQQGNEFDYLILVPVYSMLSATLQIWLIPLLILEIIPVEKGELLRCFNTVFNDIPGHAAARHLGDGRKAAQLALAVGQEFAGYHPVGRKKIRPHRFAVFVRSQIDRDAVAFSEQVVVERAAPEIIQAFTVQFVRQFEPVGLDRIQRPQGAVKCGKQTQMILRELQIGCCKRFRLQIFISSPS